MLELRNLYYSVEDNGREKEILRNINIKIEDDFVAITGPNGSGKSTMAKIIVGIIKPTRGQIFFDGKDITNLDITERANMGISFAFQQPVRFKGITVRQILALAAARDLSGDEACEYLSEVGLCANEYLDRELNDKLSGGELKRVEIAMIIARGTKLSVLDEPEAGIDLWSFQNLIEVFEHMNKKYKGNILIISHQERILNIADKIILMEDGRVKEIGRKDEILPELLEVSNQCKFLKGE